ncbi:MAG: bifunctional serine/threonine-protein kinase/universal stress protein [Gallionella sp.]|nr:bifunctional serine/threonine-protein kinase/universal stress protein [Gallionella sp.]
MTDTAGQLPALEPGSKFDGFTIEKQIGEGGMARLFLAHDENGRQRVLKVPHRTLDADPVAMIAFENELRLAHYLEDFPYAHMPVSQSGGECRYLVMDYIPGANLWTHLCARGCLSESEAIAMAKKIVHALADLHRRRIVHLDVKLSNIMITPDDEVRLIDFGLSNHLDLPDLIYESFQEPKGTPAYIAPEQFFGVRDEPRSDIFSIGTMLYEMTTSKLPFPDAHSELGVINRIKGDAVSPRRYRPELSEGFAALVMICLQNLPDRRFAGMDALYMALEQIESAAAAATAPPAIAARAPVPAMRGSKMLARLTGQFLSAIRSAEGGKLDEIKAWIAGHLALRTPRYRIVAALDNDSRARVALLNRKILAEAVRQAGLQPSIITVLTVLREHNVAIASTERERKERNAAYQETREAMTRIIADFARDDLPIGVNIRSGEPADAISSCVTDLDADLLVVGARRLNALSRFVLGSTAYKVITTIKCPIMVIQENTILRKAPASSVPQPQADRAPVGGAEPG